jgi:hypothetical protein
VITARFPLEPPVRAGHAALGVLPGAVEGVGLGDGAAVVAAADGVAVRVAEGAAVVAVTVGGGEMLTGTSGVQASNVSKKGTMWTRRRLLICR